MFYEQPDPSGVPEALLLLSQKLFAFLGRRLVCLQALDSVLAGKLHAVPVGGRQRQPVGARQHISGEAELRELCSCVAPAPVWHEGQFELGHAAEFDMIVFNLLSRVVPVEIPLLAHDLVISLPAVG